MNILKINFHTHTNYCDGKNSAEEMILSAIEKGFSTLGFSSHSIYPLSSDFYLSKDKNWHIKNENLLNYINEINFLKNKYSDKIDIKLGFEADYFVSKKIGKAVPDKNMYSVFNTDFLIGSVHFVNTKNGFYSVDNYTDAVKNDLIRLYTNPKTGKIDGKTAVCEYFLTQREMLKKGNFEIWGHPDLIRKRNGDIHFFDEKESWYKKELIATAKAAAKAGVIAEINTGAIYRKAMDDCYPSQEFMEILYSYKIPVCINSDSHDTESLDYAFDRALFRAKKTGYTELIYPGNLKVKI